MTEVPKSSNVVDKKTVIVMIGLPARGKSYVVNMLHRYLNWIGYNTRAFNAGDYRRKLGFTSEPSDFFDPNNKASKNLRNKFATFALDDLIGFLNEGGDVGIFDATNTTRERRAKVIERCWHAEFNILFIESICNDPVLLQKNYDMKLSNSDYAKMDPEEARKDFQNRLRQYESIYETLDEKLDKNISYIKLYNVGEYLTANRCNGVLESEVVFYLLNAHIKQRKIWLCLHGETDYDVNGILGGDPDLNENGIRFSKELHEFDDSFSILCDTSHRVYQTVRPLQYEYTIDYCNLLRELDGGDFDQMTYEQIKRDYPKEYKRRQDNRLRYRYPGGESYLDVKERCHRVLMKLIGSRDNMLVVAHTAVLRVILSYFLDVSPEVMPDLTVELNTIYELEPTAYCTKTKEYKLL